ncbi:copper amine oxidase [Caldanaerobacter subterraneus subsp. yonseiensis KB-1]|uniref:Copper amine oxidase n=1 Tax=Caldanaerobacter subterraneus subsp. yonseiensis KB-1 TaxID=1388761 RepID=U5CGS6_CALSX|nr:stalk domain-containing protein [Caldanaerobacter subterraneus]ERM92135.1 copper amine oxidase [Caldanaerobacter subterraneus subsp. yonseiensis KB-1]
MEIVKRFFTLIFSFIFFSVIVSQPLKASAQEKAITVLLDGYPLEFEVAPQLEEGTTLVPFRAIAEALNVNVDWNEASQTVTATYKNSIVKLQVGNKIAYKNNTPFKLLVAPKIVNNRVLIPLRFFSEAFGFDVKWEQETYTVKINSPAREMSVIGFYALGDEKTSSWTNLFGKKYPEYDTGNTQYFTSIALGWYSLDSSGNLLTKSSTGWQRPEGWEKVLEALSKYKLKSEMVLHVTDGDGTLSNLLFSDEAVRKAISAISEEAKLYDGINLDFEGLGLTEKEEDIAKIKEKFTEFVELLREKIGSSKTITLTLHAPNSAYKGYDYKLLGQVADKIIVMAYDYGQKPEPEKLVIQAIEETLKEVPKEKVILGISIPSETPESFAIKVGLAKRYGLNGIALWRLGLINDEMWEVLKTSIIPAKT